VRKEISAVSSLDADRMLSSLLAAVLATQRTTYYAQEAGSPLVRSAGCTCVRRRRRSLTRSASLRASDCGSTSTSSSG